MNTSIWRHLHSCRRGRAATAWGGSFILALALAALALAALALAAPGALARAPATKTPAPRPTPACRDTNLEPTASDLARVNAATLCLVNKVRAASRLRALRLSGPLQGVAANQARDMVLGDYFGDNSISGLTPMQRILATPYRAHARRLVTAQNIGWATGPLASPAAMVNAWMASPPHRAIMLTAGYRDVGVGVDPAAPSSLSQGLAGATYTVEFGVRIFVAKAARRR